MKVYPCTTDMAQKHYAALIETYSSNGRVAYLHTQPDNGARWVSRTLKRGEELSEAEANDAVPTADGRYAL